MDKSSNYADELASRCADAMYERDQCSPALGIEIVKVQAGEAEMRMEIKPWMANGAGVCHGGLIFTLADTAMAFASNSYNEQMLAINATVEFIAAGKVGELLNATARQVHRAGRTATYEVSVADSESNIIAQFLGRTYKVKGQHVDG